MTDVFIDITIFEKSRILYVFAYKTCDSNDILEKYFLNKHTVDVAINVVMSMAEKSCFRSKVYMFDDVVFRLFSMK